MKNKKINTIKAKKTASPKSSVAATRPVAPKTSVRKTVKKTASSKSTAKPATAKASTVPAGNSRLEITSQIIASRAYSLWEQRGRPQGQDQELWLLAERQLKESQSFAA